MRVVREADAWCDRDVVLDRRERGDIAVGLDPNAVTERAARFDGRVVRDVTVVADDGVLADEYVVADVEPVPDPNAVSDLRSASDPRVPADPDRAGRGPSRIVPEADAVVDERARAEDHMRGQGHL